PAAPAGPQAHKGFSEKEFASAEAGAAANGADASTHGDGAVWHLVIDREQIGPMTVDEVRARAARGEIDGETYAWREGCTGWQKLVAITEFADLMSSPQVAAASAPVAAGLFGGARAEAGDLFAAAQASDEAPEEGLFASTPATTLDTRSPYAHAQQ